MISNKNLAGLLYACKPHQREAMEALSAGMGRFGDVGIVVSDWHRGPFDFVAVWGMRPSVPPELSHLPRLYLEAGYINGTGPDYVSNRLRFVSVEWDGVAGLASTVVDFRPDRWESLGISLSPWKRDGRKCLLLEQSQGDVAADGSDYDGIAADLVSWGYTVRRRGHPLGGNKTQLQDDLDWADLACTFASTAAVEAVIAGLPTIALSPRCVAYPVCSHDIGEPPWRGDRRPFFHRLGYRQWTHQELAVEAWGHVRSRLQVEQRAYG